MLCEGDSGREFRSDLWDDMLKLAGCFLILAGMYGIGWVQCRNMEEHINDLELLHTVFSIVESEVGYNRSILPDGFRKAGERVGGNLGIRLQQMWKRMNDGQGVQFQEIWTDEMEHWLRRSSLKRNERNLISSFAQYIGLTDGYIQTKQLQLIRQELQEAKKLAQEKMGGKKKMVMSVSVTGGLLLMLLLL